LSARRDSPKNVTPADNHGKLDAELHHFANLVGHSNDCAAVNAVGIITHQGLA
jgi:hypothetical protein